jgi:hypothetical protein
MLYNVQDYSVLYNSAVLPVTGEGSCGTVALMVLWQFFSDFNQIDIMHITFTTTKVTSISTIISHIGQIRHLSENKLGVAFFFKFERS